MIEMVTTNINKSIIVMMTWLLEAVEAEKHRWTRLEKLETT